MANPPLSVMPRLIFYFNPEQEECFLVKRLFFWVLRLSVALLELWDGRDFSKVAQAGRGIDSNECVLVFKRFE